MRLIDLPSGRRAILSDTVGFISELPTELVSAFRATLEEVAGADLILHVRDAAHPDSAAQYEDVLAVLDGMAATGMLDQEWRTSSIDVLNKIDLLEQPLDMPPEALAVSALTGAGLDRLRDAVDARLGETLTSVSYQIPAQDGARLAYLYRHGEIIQRDDLGDLINITVRLSPEDRARFEHE
jgi:GTP-binding protein HflX